MDDDDDGLKKENWQQRFSSLLEPSMLGNNNPGDVACVPNVHVFVAFRFQGINTARPLY